MPVKRDLEGGNGRHRYTGKTLWRNVQTEWGGSGHQVGFAGWLQSSGKLEEKVSYVKSNSKLGY